MNSWSGGTVLQLVFTFEALTSGSESRLNDSSVAGPSMTRNPPRSIQMVASCVNFPVLVANWAGDLIHSQGRSKVFLSINLIVSTLANKSMLVREETSFDSSLKIEFWFWSLITEIWTPAFDKPDQEKIPAKTNSLRISLLVLLGWT